MSQEQKLLYRAVKSTQLRGWSVIGPEDREVFFSPGNDRDAELESQGLAAELNLAYELGRKRERKEKS